MEVALPTRAKVLQSRLTLEEMVAGENARIRRELVNNKNLSGYPVKQHFATKVMEIETQTTCAPRASTEAEVYSKATLSDRRTMASSLSVVIISFFIN